MNMIEKAEFWSKMSNRPAIVGERDRLLTYWQGAWMTHQTAMIVWALLNGYAVSSTAKQLAFERDKKLIPKDKQPLNTSDADVFFYHLTSRFQIGSDIFFPSSILSNTESLSWLNPSNAITS